MTVEEIDARLKELLDIAQAREREQERRASEKIVQ
jgi:hypothetical protein